MTSAQRDITPKVRRVSDRWEDPKPAIERPRLIRGLFYGDFGQGKTSLTREIVAAIGGNTLTITTDSAWPIMLDNPSVAKNLVQKEFRPYGSGFTMLTDAALRYGDATQIQNLVWDTASGGIDVVLRAFVKNKKYNDQKDPDSASWTHYDILRYYLSDMMDVLKNTKLNIFYLAHLRDPTQQDIDRGKFAKRPSAPEQTFKILATECNLVGYCFKENRGGGYKFQTEGTIKEVAKSQISTIKQTTYNQEQIPNLIKQWLDSEVRSD